MPTADAASVFPENSRQHNDSSPTTALVQHWFIGYTRSCQERKVAQALSALGVENYLPIQQVVRQWSDRKKKVDKLVLPGMVFVHTDEPTRVKLLSQVYGLRAYMTRGGAHTPVWVPDVQLQMFQHMVMYGREEVSVTSDYFAPGDRVRVVSGPLKGLECELINLQGRQMASIRLAMLGTAMVEISLGELEKIGSETQIKD